jgi:hypothetical protein
MGQAKKRGTFEERRQQSIDRTEAERLERQREEAEWWNSLTDEQKENVRKNRARRARNMQALAMWMGAAHSLGGRF